MKTKTPTAPPASPSVSDAERAVTEAAAELGDIQIKIAAAEASLPALALDPDDSKYESASLEIGRLQRAQLRAQARLEQARTELAEAKARAEQDRRHDLYDAGQKAAAEIEKLVGVYAEHAAKIAEVFKDIDQLRQPVEAANDALPAGEGRIDARHALGIYLNTELPPTTEGGPRLWWRSNWRGDSPLVPPPPPIVGHVLVDGVYTPFDASKPGHVAALAAEKSKPAFTPVAQRSAPQPVAEREVEIRPDGSRVFKMPACEWPGAVR